MPRALLLLLLLNACTQPLPEMTATVAEGCGNGRVEGEEECDDGNINDRDACTNGCKHAICGDQILRADLGAGAEEVVAAGELREGERPAGERREHRSNQRPL